MKNVAYLRVSTDQQDLNNQRLAILEYAHQQGIQIDQFIQSQMSSRKSPKDRQLDYLLDNLEANDTLIVSELSRLGRSLGQIIQFIDEIVAMKVNFIALKEDIALVGKRDIKNKVMIAMFGLFAEIERDLISQRTKEGMAKAKERGKRPGRPKGSKGQRKLDGKEGEIQSLLEKEVSKSSIAKILGVSRGTLRTFIADFGLE